MWSPYLLAGEAKVDYDGESSADGFDREPDRDADVTPMKTRLHKR